MAVFSRRQAGVKQSLPRTDRQWLHSNLWGGSGTALFLALHSRVSVSCGSYQLPGLMIGPRPSHPPVPATPFHFSCPRWCHCRQLQGGLCFQAAWLTEQEIHPLTHTHSPALTPSSVSASLQYSMCLCFCPIIDLGPSRRGSGSRDRSKLLYSDLHFCTAAAE